MEVRWFHSIIPFTFSICAFEDLIATEIDITLFPENTIPTQLRPHKTVKWWRHNFLRKYSKKVCEILPG